LLDTRVIAKQTCTEHAWGTGSITVPATCVDKGEMKYTCGLCGETKTEEIAINPNNHDWNDGMVTTVATCTTTGEMTFTWKNNASHTYTETIDALGHDWDDGTVTTPATCEDEGVMTYKCKNDPNHTYTETIDALGHDWDDGVVTKEPTYEEEGEMTYTCSRCPDTTKIEPIPVLKYTVKFVDDDGKEIKSEDVTKGGSATPPANPTKPGYVFLGWDKTFGNIDGDITVAPKWTLDKITPEDISNLKIEQTDFITGTASGDGTTVGDLLDQLKNEDIYIKIFDLDGTVIDDPDILIGTGMVVELWIKGSLYDTKTIVVRFDLTGDGALDEDDYIKFYDYFSSTLKFDDFSKAQQLALDIKDDLWEDFIAFMAFSQAYSMI